MDKGIEVVAVLMTVFSIVIAIIGIVSFTDIPDKQIVETIKTGRATTVLSNSNNQDQNQNEDKILAHNQLREYEKAKDINDNTADSNFTMSIVYYNIGDLENANKTLATVPHNNNDRLNQIWYTQRLINLNEDGWINKNNKIFETMPLQCTTNTDISSNNLHYNNKTCTLDELEQIQNDIKKLNEPEDFFAFNFHNTALPATSIQESISYYITYVAVFILVSFVTTPLLIFNYIRKREGSS